MFTMKNSITELSRGAMSLFFSPLFSIDDSNYIHPEFWPEAWKNSRKMRWKILTWSIIVAQWFCDERKKTIKTSALVNFQWNFNFNSKYETLTECQQRMEPREWEEWACEMEFMGYEELNIFSNEINFKCSTVEKGQSLRTHETLNEKCKSLQMKMFLGKLKTESEWKMAYELKIRRTSTFIIALQSKTRVEADSYTLHRHRHSSAKYRALAIRHTTIHFDEFVHNSKLTCWAQIPLESIRLKLLFMWGRPNVAPE